MSNVKRYGWIILYVGVLTAMILYSMQSSVEPTSGAEGEKVTLTFRHSWTKEHDKPILGIFEDVVNQYQADHPHVKVNFEGLDQTIHREQKLKSEMVTGTPPDMFVLFGGAEFEPYARSERLMDLTDFVKELDLEFRDLHLWTFNDHVYGLPFEGHAEPIFYNRTIFAELGLAPPETIEQLTEAIRILRGNGYIPFALGNEELWPGAIYAHYLMDRHAGPSLIQELVREGGRASFYNADYLQALNDLQMWSREGAFNARFSDASTEEAIALFTSGEAAMYLNGNWDITMFRGRPVEDEIGVIPFPTLAEGQVPSITGGYTIGIALSSNLTEEQKTAALNLLKVIYTEEVQSRIVYEGQRLPSMIIPIDSTMTGPVFAQVSQLMEETEETFIAYDNVLSPEVKKTFLEVIDQLLEGSMTGEEALTELDAASAAYWRLRDS